MLEDGKTRAMIFVIWFLECGSIITILGAITLRCVPQWRVTKNSFLTFVVGGFTGVIVLTPFAIQGLQDFFAWAHIYGSNRYYGTILGFLVVILSAELGGAVFVYVLARVRKDRTKH
jgi:hypothetical protein